MSMFDEFYPAEIIYPPSPWDTVKTDDDVIEYCATDEDMAVQIIREWLGITGECNEVNIKELFWDWLSDENKARLAESYISDNRLEADFDRWYREMNY